MLDIDPGVADMVSVGEAVMALLRAGEQLAHQSRDAADRLDDVEATVVELRALVEGLELFSRVPTTLDTAPRPYRTARRIQDVVRPREVEVLHDLTKNGPKSASTA